MDIEYIKSVTEIFLNAKLTSLEISDGDIKIALKKENISFAAENVTYLPEKTIPKAPKTDINQTKTDENSINFNALLEVKSPLVGVFYSSPSPEKPPFVAIGSKVKKGDTLCIVEAMKQMNEITAENDGEIVDICIKNGDIAEYDQVLFKMF